jgi:hypothetical protein
VCACGSLNVMGSGFTVIFCRSVATVRGGEDVLTDVNPVPRSASDRLHVDIPHQHLRSGFEIGGNQLVDDVVFFMENSTPGGARMPTPS